MEVNFDTWKHVYWYSGGKDSTSMILLALKEKWKVDKILFFDNGILHQEAYNAMSKLAPLTTKVCEGITVVKPKLTFEYMLTQREVVKRDGDIVKGYGWPKRGLGWCCRWEQNTLRAYERQFRSYIEFQAVIVGDSAELRKRDQCKWRKVNYPLVDRKLTAEDTLQICKDNGFDFNGYYDRGNRHLSCKFCPYNHMSEFQRLYQEDSESWQKLKRLDSLVTTTHTPYRKGKSVQEWEDKFIKDAQGNSGIDERQFEVTTVIT